MKPTCINLQTISDYLSGNLNQKLVSDIEEHLYTCARCREQIILSQEILNDPELIGGSEISETEANDIIQNLDLTPGFIKTCKKGFESIVQNIQYGWHTYKDHFSKDFSSKLALAPVKVRNSEQQNQKTNKLYLKIQDISIEIAIIPATNNCCHLNFKLFDRKKRDQNCRITITDSNKKTSSRLANNNEIKFENVPYGECNMQLFTNGKSIGKTNIYTGS